MNAPVPRFTLSKAGGPYIGPRGGKWADPKHTIPWKPGTAPKPKAATGIPTAGQFEGLLRNADIKFVNVAVKVEQAGQVPPTLLVTTLKEKDARKLEGMVNSAPNGKLDARVTKFRTRKNQDVWITAVSQRDSSPVEERGEMISALEKKIARQGKGHGGEVKLSKPELLYLLDSGRYALISAGPNPEYKEHKGMSAKEAKRRHEELRGQLQNAGYMYSDVQGHYGAPEATFLVMVHDITRGDAREFGQYWKQDSVIWSDKGEHEAHYTFGENADKNLCAEGNGWEEKQKAKDYFTRYKHPDGTTTKFSLNIDFENLKPCRLSKSGALLTLVKARDRLPGGRADKKKPSDFDVKQLRIGTDHELEHTKDRKLAREIAMDHLAEDPRYYEKLARMEKAGPYIGPKGGKWADPAHTIPYKEAGAREPASQSFDWAPTGQPKPPDFKVSYTALGGRAKMEKRKVGRATRFVIELDGKEHVLPNRKWTIDQAGAALREIVSKLKKAEGGPFIGPKGGKWADAAHKIPYEEKQPSKFAHLRFTPPEWMHGNLGVEIGKMPKIDYEGFLNRLRDRGVGTKGMEPQAKSLKPIQKNVHVELADNRDNLSKLINPNKPIVISKDGYVIDGHLLWGLVASTSPDERVEAIRVDLDREALLSEARVYERDHRAPTLIGKAAHKLQGRKKFRGLDISIENRKGSVRKWIDHAGTLGKTKMTFPYGYIRYTEGADGDHVDCFLGPNEQAENVYIVDAMRKPGYTKFDEHKCFLGFNSEKAARDAFNANYDNPRVLGRITTMSFDEFAQWVDKRSNTQKPADVTLKKAGARPGGKGWTPIPKTRKGGYRKRTGSGWQYWYPGKGTSAAPQPGQERSKRLRPVDEPPPRPEAPKRAPGPSARRVQAFSDSTADPEKQPGLYAIESGNVALARERTYERAQDGKNIRTTRWVPEPSDAIKLALIDEFTPLIRKRSGQAERGYALRPRYVYEGQRKMNETQQELQRSGVEGLLRAIKVYKGDRPFARVANAYVTDHVRFQAVRELRGGFEVPDVHMRNMRRFIAARARARQKFQTIDPTPEEISKVWDLKLKHIHGGIAPYRRNEDVPFDVPYKLAVGRHGARPDDPESFTSMRDVVTQPPKVEWARMYGDFLLGQGKLKDLGEEGVFSGLGIGVAIPMEEQIAARAQLDQAVKAVQKLGPITMTIPAPGSRTGKLVDYRVKKVSEMIMRRMGIGKFHEHTIQELSHIIPVTRHDLKTGKWIKVKERTAHNAITKAVEDATDKLKAAVAKKKIKAMVDQAVERVVPTEVLPEGKTYGQRLREEAANVTDAEIKAFRGEWEAKTVRMSREDVALEVAKRSEVMKPLARAMRAAMTRHTVVERTGINEGIAHVYNPSTKTRKPYKVSMLYDPELEPTREPGEPVRKSGASELGTKILRELREWPELMTLLLSANPHRVLCKLQREVGVA